MIGIEKETSRIAVIWKGEGEGEGLTHNTDSSRAMMQTTMEFIFENTTVTAGDIRVGSEASTLLISEHSSASLLSQHALQVPLQHHLMR